MHPGALGYALAILGVIASIFTIVAYGFALHLPHSRRALTFGRIGYGVTAASVLGTFLTLGFIVFTRDYHYTYAVEHTSNALENWFRFAATWAGQEGSFLLWAAWTAVIGVLVLAKAGKYEARVMPFFVSILTFLCLIIWKQSPFHLLATPSAADLAANPDWHFPPLDGQGLNASLQNYWMTIHPPTIFFGFASLAVPFVYALAALIWKDYKGWTSRVMPYALMSSAMLGLGLFMGGYWAYETLGWHGFWAWDPVENASFFPWLAVTALMHGLVVQKSRGGMARTNTFLGLLAFWLFLVGTYLTRSGALSGNDANGQMLSVHAFDNIGKSGLFFMTAMLLGYGILGLGMWLIRLRSMPTRPTTGETLVSRDFAFFMAILLMMVACVVVTLGTTRPLFQSWMHHSPSSPEPSFYNRMLLPITLAAAFLMAGAPWLAWRKTDPDKFLRKLLVPWLVMLAFGFFMIVWVQGAERGLSQTIDPASVIGIQTAKAWINPSLQRVMVVMLSAMGFLAALSNSMLAYRVFRAKPLAAGGWLAHVGIGLLIVGVIVSNTYERTERFTLVEGDAPREAFGYKFAFEGMTGKPIAGRPLNPEYDRSNSLKIRIAPPGIDEGAATNADSGAKTFVSNPRWFVQSLNVANEAQLKYMSWPAIERTPGHDLYLSLADTPERRATTVKLELMKPVKVGSYELFYYKPISQPGKYIGALIYIKTDDGKVIPTQPGLQVNAGMINTDVDVKELPDEHGVPGAILLKMLDPATKVATVQLSLPGIPAQWQVPLEVTYKPWINLVWAGVIIAVSGTLLAMFRRTIEARKSDDDDPGTGDADLSGGDWIAPVGDISSAILAMPIKVERVPKQRRSKPV